MNKRKIITCKKCFYTSNHPLGITFDENGICSGCTIHEEKYELDWDYRFSLLRKLVSQYKSKKGNYDCIVPVTGGNDSFFIVHTVKNILGLNPLLVNYNKYFNTPIGISNLTNLRTSFNCDILIQNVNPNSVKKITRETLRRFGNIYWHCIAGQTVFPVQTAISHKIPLIIWGAHQGIEQVGMFSHKHEVEMSRRYRHNHDLFGYEADDLIDNLNTINDADIWQYRYPDDHLLNLNGIRGIYLSNYIPWDPKTQHEMMVEIYGYKSREFNRTFDTYDFVDCYNYMEIHDYLKFLKHGYSKVVDHVSREIRHKRIDKKKGLKIIRKYIFNKPLYTDLLCEWLSIDKLSLDYVVNSFHNKSYWNYDVMKDSYELNSKNIYQEKLTSGSNYLEGFTSNSTINQDLTEKYITIGKGC